MKANHQPTSGGKAKAKVGAKGEGKGEECNGGNNKRANRKGVNARGSCRREPCPKPTLKPNQSKTETIKLNGHNVTSGRW